MTKVALLLDLHEHLQKSSGGHGAAIYLPMDRSAMAEYLGLSLAAVSRAFQTLVSQRIISFSDRRHARILDRAAFERVAEGD